MFKSFTLLFLAASLGVLVNYYFVVGKKNKFLSQAVATADPEKNYKEFCASCHGEKMDAFVDRKWKHGSTEQDLFKAIKVGYPDDGMPGFDTAFTDNEINDLVDYIVTGIKNVKRYEFNEPVRSNVFKTDELTVKLDTVVKGIKIPWGMAFLPTGEMLVTERGGKMYRVTKSKAMQEISGVPEVVAEGQGGLLDVELHPNFKTNGLVYISYSMPKPTENGLLSTTAIARAKLSGNKLTGVKNIFEAQPLSRTRHHYGCRLEFGKDGYLYFTIGDRGAEKQNPQNLKSHAGKTHRIKDDGSIPADNPFVNTPDALPSIYSYGHRNQQGVVIHPKTGEIWTHEHGPRGGDEINIVRKGKNYGWPLISYGINYNGTVITDKSEMEGMEQPLKYWIPSIGPSGMAFVVGDKYKGWKNDLLVGSLRFKYLNRCKMRGDKVVKEEILFKNIGRVRDVRMAPDGYIYVAVENPGAIFRLVPVKG